MIWRISAKRHFEGTREVASVLSEKADAKTIFFVLSVLFAQMSAASQIYRSFAILNGTRNAETF